MPRLIAPTTALHSSWLESRDEWGHGVFQSGSGMSEKLDLDSVAGFADWVAVLHRRSDTTTPTEPGFVPATYWWIVEDDTYLGAITLRHELNDFLLKAGGHIGYSVRPSARRRGLASWALGEVLRRARDLGLSRVLVTCDDDNVGSARTIEKNGGVLEDVRDTTLGRTRRYWIAV
jgi:predicted acetyltransferase